MPFMDIINDDWHRSLVLNIIISSFNVIKKHLLNVITKSLSNVIISRPKCVYKEERKKERNTPTRLEPGTSMALKLSATNYTTRAVTRDLGTTLTTRITKRSRAHQKVTLDMTTIIRFQKICTYTMGMGSVFVWHPSCPARKPPRACTRTHGAAREVHASHTRRQRHIHAATCMPPTCMQPYIYIYIYMHAITCVPSNVCPRVTSHMNAATYVPPHFPRACQHTHTATFMHTYASYN